MICVRYFGFLIALLFLPSNIFAVSIEREVRFLGEQGATLAGTIQLPARAGKSPALILLAGSGPTDRDGNQPPALMTDLLKQVAQGLAEEGIVTLRFDKRGMYANKGELPKEVGQYGDFFSWENFVGDAAAAFRFLREQPEVDTERVGILGHSEGGLLALEAARVLKSEGHPPRVLILLSTPGRPAGAVITEQLTRLMAGQGATLQQSDYFLRENERITHAIIETGQVPSDVPAGLAALYPGYLGKFLHSELAVDPCKLVADFSGPVMLVAGSADTQVSAERDAKALDAALSARKNDVHTLAIIAKASHNLKLVQKPGEAGFEGPVAPAAMDRVKEWAHKHLAGQ